MDEKAARTSSGFCDGCDNDCCCYTPLDLEDKSRREGERRAQGKHGHRRGGRRGGNNGLWRLSRERTWTGRAAPKAQPTLSGQLLFLTIFVGKSPFLAADSFIFLASISLFDLTNGQLG